MSRGLVYTFPLVLHRCPENSKIKLKMVYTSSKSALTKKLTGLVTKPVEAHDDGDMVYAEVVKSL